MRRPRFRLLRRLPDGDDAAGRAERNRKFDEMGRPDFAELRWPGAGKSAGKVPQDWRPILPMASRSNAGLWLWRAAWGGTFPEPKPNCPGMTAVPDVGLPLAVEVPVRPP